jgi:hypothetical protein
MKSSLAQVEKNRREPIAAITRAILATSGKEKLFEALFGLLLIA